MCRKEVESQGDSCTYGEDDLSGQAAILGVDVECHEDASEEAVAAVQRSA